MKRFPWNSGVFGSCLIVLRFLQTSLVLAFYLRLFIETFLFGGLRPLALLFGVVVAPALSHLGFCLRFRLCLFACFTDIAFFVEWERATILRMKIVE